MKFLKFLLPVILIGLLTSCASHYKNITPDKGNFYSKSLSESGVLLEYKYQIPSRKYRRRARKKDIQIVSVKITNNSARDLVFGNDLKLVYEKTNNPLELIDRNVLYKSMKQRTAYYLFYLALSPLQLYSTTSNQYGETTSSGDAFPAGLILGPGLTASNVLMSSSANSKFKKNLAKYDLTGVKVKAGTTAYGIIGVRSKTQDNIKTN